MRRVLLVAALTAGVLAGAAGASTPRWHVWVCKPGLAHDWCQTNLSVTDLLPDGSRSSHLVYTPRNPPVDCFYVYPTVSQEKRGNADLKIQFAEKAVAQIEGGRFEQMCRVFAPIYRQDTAYTGTSPFTQGDPNLAYHDVRAAWHDYLAHDNHGRGVVLIGHSQGSYELERLLADPAEQPAIHRVLISALLLGGGVDLVHDRYAGFPACRSRTQTGCLAGYSSWDRTPPANAAFENVSSPAQRIMCVNPGAPGGGSSSPITPIFPWFAPDGITGTLRPTPKTVWVAEPGLYTARCVQQRQRAWLLVTRIHRPGDKRETVREIASPTWGLHPADVSIALGQLVALARSEAAAWLHHH